MSFHLTIPSSPPSLSNGYASHHKDFMSSLSFQNELGSPPTSPPTNRMHSNTLTSPTNRPRIDSLGHHHHHHHQQLVGDHHITIKPDPHLMYSQHPLHTVPIHPSHLHPYANPNPSVIPTQLNGKHIGVLAAAGPAKHPGVVDFRPPTLSHTPVIIAE